MGGSLNSFVCPSAYDGRGARTRTVAKRRESEEAASQLLIAGWLLFGL